MRGPDRAIRGLSHVTAHANLSVQARSWSPDGDASGVAHSIVRLAVAGDGLPWNTGPHRQAGTANAGHSCPSKAWEGVDMDNLRGAGSDLEAADSTNMFVLGVVV